MNRAFTIWSFGLYFGSGVFAQANLSVTPNSVSDSTPINIAVPDSQLVAVSSTGAPLTFNASVNTSSGGSWLTIDVTSSTTPKNLAVTFNPAGLVAGVYNGSITISSPAASNGPQVVAAQLVIAALGATISASPPSLIFSTRAGSLSPVSASVSLSTSGGSLPCYLSTNTSSGGNWLTADPIYGATPETILVTANPAGLPPGVYNGSIIVTAIGATNSPIALPVQLANQTLTIATTSLPPAVAGVPYVPVQLIATGAIGAITWAQTGLPAPTGLTFSKTGLLSGTPTSSSTGVYSMTITASDSGAVATAQLDLSIEGVITLSALNFRLATAGGADLSATQAFSLDNGNSGPATVDVAPSAPWITVYPSKFALGAGVQSQPISVQINREYLPPGTSYVSGTIGISGLSSPAQLQVNVALEDQPGLPLLSRSGMTFIIDVQEPYSDFNNLSQIVTVINDGQSAVNLQQVTSSAALVTPNWIPISGRIPPGGQQQVTVTVSNTNLISTGGGGPNGAYQALLSFVFDDGSLDELLVTVVVQQGSTAQELLLDKTGLIFSSAASQDVLVSNYASQDYTLTATPQFGWIHAVPASQQLSGGGGQMSITVTVDTNAPLDAAGVARGFITISYLMGATQIFSQQVEVLFLGNTGSNSSTPSLVHTASSASGCVPGSLDAVFSLLSEGATVSVGLPAQVDVRILDNCADPITTGAATVSFSNGDHSVVLLPTGNGSWQGTWQPQKGSSALLTVAEVSGGMTGTATRSVQIVSSGQVLPYVSTGSVLNAASLTPSVDRVAPGSIISIFGDQLASETLTATSPLPLSLASTQVRLGTTALPLFYVSPNQINALVPPGIQLNSSTSLVVTTSGRQSIPVPIIPLPTDPGIFSGAVVSASGVAIGPSSPAQLGDTIIIYCTGLGTVNESLDPTLPAPTDHTVRTLAAVSVFLRGMDGSWVSSYVSFAGLAPGYSGLYQVNVQIPNNSAIGDDISLYIAAGNMQSNQVLISVR